MTARQDRAYARFNQVTGLQAAILAGGLLGVGFDGAEPRRRPSTRAPRSTALASPFHHPRRLDRRLKMGAVGGAFAPHPGLLRTSTIFHCTSPIHHCQHLPSIPPKFLAILLPHRAFHPFPTDRHTCYEGRRWVARDRAAHAAFLGVRWLSTDAAGTGDRR